MITMPAGRYYVGDLCYVMHPQWDEFCDKSFTGNSPNEGLIVMDNGVKTVHFGTFYGDGMYGDDEGREYGVDAGLIGCIRVEDIQDPSITSEADMERLGNIVVFESDFECSEDDGVMWFGDIRINTKGSEDWDEQEDDEDD